MEADNSLWEYNAPQFVDFTKPIEDDHQNADEYFNYDHENGGIPTSFSNTPEHDQRSSYRTSPQKPVTPSRGTPGRSALKDTNALTPRRSNRIKSANTPKADSNMAESNEKENIGALSSSAQPVEKSTKNRMLSNLCTDPEEWERKKTASQRTAVDESKKTGLAQKRAADVISPRENMSPTNKRLRRSVSSVLPRPGMSMNDAKTRSRSHYRSSSSQKANLSQPKPLKSQPNIVPEQAKAHVRTNSTQAKPHVRTNSAQAKPHVRTNSAQAKPHVRTNSAQAKSHVRTNSAQAKAHVRTNSAQAKAHVRTNSAQAKAHVRTNSAQAKPLVRSNSSADRSRPVEKHQRTSSSSALYKNRSVSVERRTRNSVGNEKTESIKLKPRLTVPSTPAVLKHDQLKTSSAADQKTSEQREMEQIKKLRRELALKRKMAEESYKLAQSSHGYAPIRSTHLPTRPEGFNFATDQRIKNPDGDGKPEMSEKDFASSLRRPRSSSGLRKSSRHNVSTDGQKGACASSITVPEPFHLHESKRKEDEKKYQSTAEMLQAFSSKTPDRFRTKPKNQEPGPLKKGKEQILTVPKTPNLETKGRYRPVTITSQADIEAQELEEIKKYQFRANPLNKKLLSNPNSGIQRVQPKEPTQAEGFELETDRRIRERQDQKHDADDVYEFHANPIPKGILDGPVGIKPATEIPLTRPASPAFALKNRLRSFKQQAEAQMAEEAKHTVRANPVPHHGVPFQPKLSHKVTNTQAFSFEKRDKKMFAKKEEKIQKLLEEQKKMREFHANPLPSDSPDVLPVKAVKPPTQPEPFAMENEHRLTHRADEWAQKVRPDDMEEELRQRRAQAAFKAKPAKSLLMQPFIPKRSTKVLTDVQEFSMSTDRRRERWAELERFKHEKESEIAAITVANEKRKREEEEQEIKRLRSEAVHQAKPVRQYKLVDIRPSERPLTLPETPRFSDRLRSRVPDKS